MSKMLMRFFPEDNFYKCMDIFPLPDAKAWLKIHMLGKPRQLGGFPHMSMYIQEEKLFLENDFLIYFWY